MAVRRYSPELDCTVDWMTADPSPIYSAAEVSTRWRPRASESHVAADAAPHHLVGLHPSHAPKTHHSAQEIHFPAVNVLEVSHNALDSRR